LSDAALDPHLHPRCIVPICAAVFKRLFSRKAEAPAAVHRAPAGERIYAIGDIHGRLDLLDALLAKIDADDGERGPAKTRLIILGDLPDRGPDSRGVIERLMALAQTNTDIIFLIGNHEELMIRTWEGDRQVAGTFNRVGGRATLLSYGVSSDEYDSWDLSELAEKTARYVPQSHIDFMRGFRDYYRAGDYLFVHAGIAPGIAIEDQDPVDMRWIRRSFLESTADHGVMVVHGHTITGSVDERPNRIGIDTGAFESGILTAIGVEGEDRWFLST
jgi:serine/threonine protein phosphatase 1